MKGRKPKPTNMHILNGNPSKLDLEEKIRTKPKPLRIAPECPKWLKPLAKKEWNRLAPELERTGLLRIIDEIAFAALCQNYAIYIETEKYLKENGRVMKTKSGAIKTRPEVHIANNALKFVRSFASEFGLTPSSRGRIYLPNLNIEDELDSFY